MVASDSEATGVASGTSTAQLQLYQTVPLHVDNLYPYSSFLPFHTVPSPSGAVGLSTRGSCGGYQEQLAAHLGGHVKSSVYTLRTRPDTCIQWRILSDRKHLELRPLRWVNSSEGGAENDEMLASVTSTWCFDSALLDSVVIADEEDVQGQTQVSVTVCSRDGVVYRLSFASAWEISSESVDVNACTSWYTVEWSHDAAGRVANGRMPTVFDGLGGDTVVVGCEDTALVWIRWGEDSDYVRGDLHGYVSESVSSGSGILKTVKDFIPRMLRRGASGAGGIDFESGLVSFALTQVLDGRVQYAVTLGRDRKLRFWPSNQSSACQHVETMPQLDVLGSPIAVDPHGPQPPPIEGGGGSVSRNYVRIISHSAGTDSVDSGMEASDDSRVFGVMVFVPDEATPYFTLLQVTVDENGRLFEVQTVMYKVCKAANGGSQLMADDELVDFQISRHDEVVATLIEGPNGQAVEEDMACPYWTLWALWERSQEAVLTHTYFSLRGGELADRDAQATNGSGGRFWFEGHPVLGERWYTTLSPQQAMRPGSDGPQIKYIEARLSKKAGDGEGERDDNNSSNDDESDGGSSSAVVQAAEISRAFLDHLFHPTRFDRGVLGHALALYSESARDRGFGVAEATGDAEFLGAGLRVRVAKVVGSFLRVSSSGKTGALLVGEYQRSLFTEWKRYTTLCARIQRTGNAPKSLSLCGPTSMVCVVASNSIGVQQAAGVVEWMHALSERDPAASVLLSAPSHIVGAQYGDMVLGEGNARTEVARLLAVSSYLSGAMAADRLWGLAEDLSSGEMLVSYETRAAELFERYAAESITGRQIRHAARLLGLCGSAGDTIGEILRALRVQTVASEGEDEEPQWFKSSASMDGLFVSAFALSGNARYEVARDIALLGICIAYHREAFSANLVGSIAAVLSGSAKAVRLCGVAQWVSSQSFGGVQQAGGEGCVDVDGDGEGAEKSEEDAAVVDGFLRKFSVLNINHGRDAAGAHGADQAGLKQQPQPQSASGSGGVFVYSVLHDVVQRGYGLRFSGRSGAFGDMVGEGVDQIYGAMGLAPAWAGGDGGDSEASEAEDGVVQFCSRVARTAACYDHVAEGVLRRVGKSAAWSYVSGLVALRQRDYAAAGDYLNSAAAGGGAIGALEPVLAAGASASVVDAASYFDHVTELFEAARQFGAAARFGRRALEAADDGRAGGAARTSRRWFRLFHAELSRGAYEDAYVAMMATSDAEQQVDSLRHLVGVLCERADGVALLCRLGFAGQQAEVEQSLLFKARHSDVAARPCYYKILYAFHVYRGNFRNAASAMYQYARRLGGGNLAEQARALLACSNALRLVDAQHAWVVVGRAGPPRKRARTGGDDVGGGDDVDIVSDVDVRREHALCAARLALGAAYGAAGAADASAGDVVALHVRAGRFDAALGFAAAFGLARAPVLAALARTCVEAGGGGADAWQQLRRHVRDADHGARLAVAAEVLRAGADADAALPPWLAEPLLRACPHDLVRLCLREARASDAAEFLLLHIAALRSRPAPACASRALWLPYRLVDQTAAILAQAAARFDAAIASIRRARRAVPADAPADAARLKQLHASYRARRAALLRLHAALRDACDQHMAFASRESRDLAEPQAG
ncbi:hypothetical protein H4R26_001410 [Coemansia thaxteri]|uniref:Nuclear pore complex protein Nup160 n=1 Tax=Coemansia thaxteri TaxID=2663907 RepID=A0A9W8EKI4_9FUNG|nr:hypothetical protein H4R26_001410 [Coemansia thaxteri]KAJ2485954.1 hypothetical protein EV174_001415 [Coemansia sp. RSA 2320]